MLKILHSHGSASSSAHATWHTSWLLVTLATAGVLYGLINTKIRILAFDNKIISISNIGLVINKTEVYKECQIIL
jgi:hypothetical protein